MLAPTKPATPAIRVLNPSYWHHSANRKQPLCAWVTFWPIGPKSTALTITKRSLRCNQAKGADRNATRRLAGNGSPPAVCLNTNTSKSKSEPFRPVILVVPMPVAADLLPAAADAIDKTQPSDIQSASALSRIFRANMNDLTHKYT